LLNTFLSNATGSHLSRRFRKIVGGFIHIFTGTWWCSIWLNSGLWIGICVILREICNHLVILSVWSIDSHDISILQIKFGFFVIVVKWTFFSDFEAGDVPVLADVCSKVPENTMDSILPNEVMSTDIGYCDEVPISPTTGLSVLNAFESLLFKLLDQLMCHFDPLGFLIIVEWNVATGLF